VERGGGDPPPVGRTPALGGVQNDMTCFHTVRASGVEA